MDRQSTSVADTITSTPSSSPLSCPICAPHLSAEDADFLYYPSDEEIPVSLCKYVYGYPRDIDSEYQTLEELGKGKSAPLAPSSSPASAISSEAALSDSSERSSS